MSMFCLIHSTEWLGESMSVYLFRKKKHWHASISVYKNMFFILIQCQILRLLKYVYYLRIPYFRPLEFNGIALSL